MLQEKPWDRVFRRNAEAAEQNNTDPNDELEKEWPGGEKWFNKHILPRLPEGGSALEIGPGSGRIARWAYPLAADLYLADYSEFACETLRDKFPYAHVIQVTDGRLTEVPDESIDIMYSISVFGHLYEEQVYRYIEEGYSKLKSGGHISLHMIDMRGQFNHFVESIPEKVDTQRNIFRYLHPDYAQMMATHVGFQNINILPEAERAYFLIATK